MSLKEKITEDMKAAMRAKDSERLATIRLVTAAIKQREVDERIELNDEQVLSVLEKMVKQRKESAGIFHQQGRADLAQTEEEEIAVLEKFLPAQLDAAALDAVIQEIIAETGASSAKDMGKVIGLANQRLAGQAEGKVIAETVKRLLNS